MVAMTLLRFQLVGCLVANRRENEVTKCCELLRGSRGRGRREYWKEGKDGKQEGVLAAPLVVAEIGTAVLYTPISLLRLLLVVLEKHAFITHGS